jgi:hypothetical protein
MNDIGITQQEMFWLWQAGHTMSYVARLAGMSVQRATFLVHDWARRNA